MFVLCKVPAERRKSKTRKDKHIAVDDDAADGECFPKDILGDYLIKGEPIDLYDLLGSDVPAAEGGSSKGPEFTKASRMVNGVSIEYTFFCFFFYGQTFPEFESFHRAFS